MVDRVSHALSLLREAVAILSDMQPEPEDLEHAYIAQSMQRAEQARAEAKQPKPQFGPEAAKEVVTKEDEKEAFAEWLRAEMKARFPDADAIHQNGINNLYQKTGGDTSLVSDLFDIAQKMNETRQKVYRPFGLMVSTLNKMNHADIREEAATWRERKATKKETITERVLRKTLEDVGPGKGRQQIDAILARKEGQVNETQTSI